MFLVKTADLHAIVYVQYDVYMPYTVYVQYEILVQDNVYIYSA